MQTYYKIVSEHTMFYRIARIQGRYDIANIPNGATFHAYKPFEPNKVIIQCSQPVLHFCDNAFDTMLWEAKFGQFVTNKYNYFYQIIPLTDVIKQRCNDSSNLYQCGANEIKFIELIDRNKMFDLAISEYDNNKTKKEAMYPNLDLDKIVKNWKQHVCPTSLYTR